MKHQITVNAEILTVREAAFENRSQKWSFVWAATI